MSSELELPAMSRWPT